MMFVAFCGDYAPATKAATAIPSAVSADRIAAANVSAPVCDWRGSPPQPRDRGEVRPIERDRDLNWLSGTPLRVLAGGLVLPSGELMEHPAGGSPFRIFFCWNRGGVP